MRPRRSAAHDGGGPPLRTTGPRAAAHPFRAATFAAGGRLTTAARLRVPPEVAEYLLRLSDARPSPRGPSSSPKAPQRDGRRHSNRGWASGDNFGAPTPTDVIPVRVIRTTKRRAINARRGDGCAEETDINLFGADISNSQSGLYEYGEHVYGWERKMNT
jgi:hypothetical protein